MSSDYFESALTSLLKPQEKDRLYKILVVVRNNVDWPNNRDNIDKLRERGCLKPLIACLQQNHLNVLNISLSILGNCCMERSCARVAVKQYNLLPHLNHILKRRKQDSIQGRIYRIIGNMCQHWDRLANTLIEKEPHLQIIPKIVAFLKSVAEDETWESDANMATNENKPSEASITMAIRALRELANIDTVAALINFGVLKVVGMLVIKFTPQWQSTKKYEDVLQVILRLLQVYSKYRSPNSISELQNTDSGNAMMQLGKLIFLSPYRVVKIIINLIKVSNSRSDLPIADISQSLIERLQNSTSFNNGREDLLHREYLKCLCFFIQYPGMKDNIENIKIIPVLIDILNDCTNQNVIILKNCILILSTLRAYNRDDILLHVMLKKGIANVLSDKLNWVLGSEEDINTNHEYRFRKFSSHKSRKRKRYGSDTCFKHQMNFESLRILPCCDSTRISSDVFSDYYKMKKRSLSPCSDVSLSSGPSFSPTSSPDLSDGDATMSDSDDYSPVCSDAECEVPVQPKSVENMDDQFERGSSHDDELDERASIAESNGTTEKSIFTFKKQLSNEIIKLIKIFVTLRPVTLELISSPNLLFKLLMFCLPWNKHICPLDTFDVVRLIVETPEYLVGLMQTDFISMAYKFSTMQHGIGCITCTDLHTIGRDILSKIIVLVENGCGKGDIAHQLFRASLPVKQRLVSSIPFVTENKHLLNKLMITCGGLNILMQLFQETSDIQQKCIIGLCIMATKLGIKNPTTCFDDKSSKCILLPINIQHYELEKNCSTVVHFKLDDGNCVEADRDFLSDKSEYFNRLLSGEFKESWQDEVRLHNVSIEALKLLLMLLQYDVKSSDIHKLDTDLNVILDVIALTDRYLMEDLNTCLTTSVQVFKFLPTTIPTIYQWSLESGTDILRVESVAFALVAGMNDSERCDMFQNLLQLGYSEHLAEDVQNMLLRSFNAL